MNAALSLKRLLVKEEIPAESERGSRLLEFLRLLEKWNLRVNLTASTEWPAIGPLFEEGIWASRLYAAGNSFHLDVGSGAGFPGVLLRILLPRIRLDMVESRGRRAAFLESVVQELGLSGSRVFDCRLDELLRFAEGGWECITWKALKLGNKDLALLQNRAGEGAEFWMFHGREPAVEDALTLERQLKLVRCEKFPGRRNWYLSIYMKILGEVNVSRETPSGNVSRETKSSTN